MLLLLRLNVFPLRATGVYDSEPLELWHESELESQCVAIVVVIFPVARVSEHLPGR